MKIIKKRLGELKKAPYNPRTISKYDMDKLRTSISKFGYVEPIVWNRRTGNVVGGNQRLLVLMETMKLEDEIDVVEVDMPLSKEKALNIALNRISGDWDEEKLSEAIQSIMDDDNELIKLTGMDDEEISRLIDAYKETEEDDFDIEKSMMKPKYKIQKGDIYQLGQHRLMCGDATDSQNVDNLMGNEKADMVFTDPPYNVNYKSKSGHGYNTGKYKHKKVFDDNKKEEDYKKFIYDIVNNIVKFTKEKCPVYFWLAIRYSNIVTQAFKDNNFSVNSFIIWIKDHLIMGHGTYHKCYESALYGWKNKKRPYEARILTSGEVDLWDLDKKDFEERLDMWKIRRDIFSEYKHPTQKPVKLAGRAIKNSSKTGDIILDLFGGSGSTLMACEQLNRKCYMMELDPIYCSVIIERWEAYTGKKHRRITVKN